MNTIAYSYRQSHLTKGKSYQATFSKNPRRRITWEIEQRILDTLFERYLSHRKVNYLDFACGTGRILQHLEGRVASSTGVDLSPEMLKIAQSRTSHSKLHQGDITQDQSLCNSKFDLITAFRFFPNAEQSLREDAISRLASLLRSDGYLVFNNHRSTNFLRNRIARLVSGGNRGNRGMSPKDVHKLIQEAGLEIIDFYHTEVVPDSDSQMFYPRWLVEIAERILARLPAACLAHNIIYVCRHSSLNVIKSP
jgi:predicted TPR repeat methyltransferase